MRYYFILTLFLIALLNQVQGQETDDSNIPDQSKMRVTTYSGSSVETLPFETGKAENVYFLTDDWIVSDLFFSNGFRLENTPSKFDVKNNQVSLMIKGVEKIVACREIDKYLVYESQSPRVFINSKQLGKAPGDLQKTLLEEIVNGQLGLYKEIEVKLLKANYVEALDAGSRKDELIKEERFYFLANGELLEAESKLNKVVKQIDASEKLYAKWKEDKLKPKKLDDLISIVSSYNQAISK